MIVSLSENGFGLDELIYRMEELAKRAIGRRIKKIGYNWKEEGVGKIARIVLKLFASEGEWADYWRMDLNQSVMLNFRILEVR